MSFSEEQTDAVVFEEPEEQQEVQQEVKLLQSNRSSAHEEHLTAASGMGWGGSGSGVSFTYMSTGWRHGLLWHQRRRSTSSNMAAGPPVNVPS